ncbi:hypothetical protein RCL1_003249 [Eukaryota sp. TZLM3-RCL]
MDILDHFVALGDGITNGLLVYVLPKKWLDSFLQGNPDPEIDFNAIIDQLKTTSLPSQPTLKTLKLLPDLAIGSDVSIVNERQWQLLTSHFTYKPKIPIIREVVPKTSDPNSELMVDLYPCTVQIRKYPECHSTPMTLSSVSPISQLRSKIASHFHTSPSSLTISFQSGTFGIMTSISPSDDDMTLSDKGIVDGSKVNIIIRHGQAISDPITSSSFFTSHQTLRPELIVPDKIVRQSSHKNPPSQSFVYKIPKNMIMIESLTCAVCLEVFTNPFESSCCNNVVCDLCKTTQTCSFCRQQKPSYRPCVPVKRMVEHLPVECSYCGHNTTKGQFDEHLKSCEKRPVKCKVCNEFVSFDLAFKHVQQHPQDVVKCLFS